MELTTGEWVKFLLVFFGPIILIIVSIMMFPRILPRDDEGNAQSIHHKIKKERKY
jgi:zinc transporter ZupT